MLYSQNYYTVYSDKCAQYVHGCCCIECTGPFAEGTPHNNNDFGSLQPKHVISSVTSRESVNNLMPETDSTNVDGTVSDLVPSFL